VVLFTDVTLGSDVVEDVISVALEGTVVPFTEVTLGSEVVADVINEPVVGSVTPLIEVTPVGVALSAIVPLVVMVPPVKLVPATMLVTLARSSRVSNAFCTVSSAEERLPAKLVVSTVTDAAVGVETVFTGTGSKIRTGEMPP
jgi:hypothetical protein